MRVLYLKLDEPAGVLPSDFEGNTVDFAPLPLLPTTAPTVVEGLSGNALLFNGINDALAAVDVAGRDTLSTRDASVTAIVTLPISNTFPGCIYSRGYDGATNRLSFGASLQVVGSDVYAWAFWHSLGGTLITTSASPCVFKNPGLLKWFALTVTRRWESGDICVVRVYVNDEVIGEVAANGSVGGSTTAANVLGNRGDNFSEPFFGAIDELAVYDTELTLEEVRIAYAKMARAKAEGRSRFADYSPPGAPWNGDNMSTLVDALGQSLGVASINAASIGDVLLPDRAAPEFIARWERALGVAVAPGSSIDARWSAITGAASTRAGYSVPAIRQLLSAPLNLAPADIEIVGFKNYWSDAFDALEDRRWHLDAASATNGFEVAGGVLKGRVPTLTSVAYLNGAHFARTQISPEQGIDDAHFLGELYTSIKVTPQTLATGIIAGLYLANWRTRKAIWFGVRKNGVNLEIVRADYDPAIGFTIFSAIAVLGTTISQSVWLVVRGDLAFDADLTLQYSLTGPTTGLVTATTFVGSPVVTEVGASLVGAGGSGATEVWFDDFMCLTPEGDLPFHWYAYRNPALGGAYDLVKATNIMQRAKDAHTHAAAIDRKSLICDVDYGCDTGPIGGLP